MFISKEKERTYQLARFGMSVGIAAAMLLAVYFRAGIYFESNDDRNITKILSGAFGGRPDAHTVYVNYWLSVLLSGLYRITLQIPWYGLMLLLFHMMSYVLILDTVIKLGRSKLKILISIGIVMTLFLQNFYSVAKIQYTSTAIVLAVAGYVYLLCAIYMPGRDSWKFLVFAVFMLLACLLRRDAMLMLQPLGLSAIVGLLLTDKRKNVRDKIRFLLLTLGIVIGCFALGELGTAVGYHNAEWKEYLRYNNARTEMFDYYGKPEYEEVSDILSEYGVSRAEYEAYKGYIILDGNLNTECAEKIAAYAKAKYRFPEIGEVLKTYQQVMLKDGVWDGNRITVASFIVAGILIVIYGQYLYLIPVSLVKVGSFVIWGYLIYKGRMPDRVILPLYFGEAAIYLTVMLVAIVTVEQKSIWKKAGAVFACMILIFMGYQSGRQQYRFLKSQNEGMEQYMQGLVELYDYVDSHPECNYLMDSFSFSYYMGAVLDNRFNGPHNYMVSGTWFSYSPIMKQAMKQYFTDDQNGFYVILYDFGVEALEEILPYMEEKTGTIGVPEEELTVSHGGKYRIYYFDRKLDLQE